MNRMLNSDEELLGPDDEGQAALVPDGGYGPPAFPAGLRALIREDVQVHGRMAAWRWYCRYLRFAIESLLWIQTQEAQVIPVRLNNIQRKALAKIVWALVHDRPIRILWLKSRRMGVTTLISCVFYILTRFQRNRTALLMANNADRTMRTFNMHKLFEAQISARFKKGHYNHIPRRMSNVRELSWADYVPDIGTFVPEGGSSIRIVSGLSSKGQAGDAFQYIHYCEIGDDRVDWDSQTKINNRCVKMGLPGSIIVLEGTTYLDEATKRPLTGAFLQQAWQRAVDGESGYDPWFDAWWEADWYEMDLEPGEVVPTFGKLPDTQARDREDVERVKELVWDAWKMDKQPEPRKSALIRRLDRKLKWRFHMLTELEGSFEWLHSQYPSYPEQAFVSRIGSYFSGVEINARLERNDKRPTARKTEGDRLTVFFEPEVGVDYAVTADPATERGIDNAAAIVYNVREMRDEAVWHGKTTLSVQAEEWSALGYRYATRTKDAITGKVEVVKPALLVPECNTVGTELIRIIRDDIGYPNLWRRRNIDKRKREGGVQYGFYTGDTERTVALAQLGLQWQSWQILDNRILRQMANFGYNSKGKLAARGSGDEFVTCYWIRAYVCEVMGWVRKADWSDLWVEPRSVEAETDPDAMLDFLNKELYVATGALAAGNETVRAKVGELQARIHELLLSRRREVARKEPWRAFARLHRDQGDWRMRGLKRNRRVLAA